MGVSARLGGTFLQILCPFPLVFEKRPSYPCNIANRFRTGMPMKHLFRMMCGATIGILLAAAAPPALGGEATEQLKETVDKVLAVLNNPDLKQRERRKLIREAADNRFDWSAMARSAMGVYWRDRTPEQKKEFTKLFTDLIESAYMAKIERYSGEKFRYVGESTEDGYGTVKVRIITHKGTEIPITYWVTEEKGQWLIYDVSIEGVSMVNNYRSQISSILTNSSYEELVKKLEEKVEREKK
jgi:phospholipid transport system substrate-binding protein